MTSIAILSVCFLIIMLSLIGIIISLHYKVKFFKAKSVEFCNLDLRCKQLLSDNSKLEERCKLNFDLAMKCDDLAQKNSILEQENAKISASLEVERKNFQEKIKLLEDAKQKLSETFSAISSDALSKNNAVFLDLAKSAFEGFKESARNDFSMSAKSVSDIVLPIKSTLENVGIKLNELEKSRVGAYEALRRQVDDMIITQKSLRNETSHLVSALKTPSVRGRWGEMQLHRVVELAGMLEHCDFEEQVEICGDGRTIRPDMIIYLPGGRQIIVDAKAPLSAYLEALEVDDENLKKNLLKEHAKQIRNHVTVLANKKYWAQFDQSPEFVIMFLPGEIFLSVATEHDLSLIEFAMQQRVIITTPTILLGLLHAIAQGWRQENLAENAKQIIKMGQDLYQRLSTMVNHIGQLGKNLNSSVQSYNSTVASLESRVLVSARKFKELDVHEKNIAELIPIEENARILISKK